MRAVGVEHGLVDEADLLPFRLDLGALRRRREARAGEADPARRHPAVKKCLGWRTPLAPPQDRRRRGKFCGRENVGDRGAKGTDSTAGTDPAPAAYTGSPAHSRIESYSLLPRAR